MRRLCVLVVGLLVVLAFASAAAAQGKATRKGKRRGAERAPTSASDKTSGKASERHTTGAEKSATASASDTDEAASAEAEAAEQDAQVRKEGDSEVKVMEFSGLDIEGQLKTPQMLYFLNRLRAEFGRPRLPHRSFMPELQRSTKGERF